MSCSAGDEVGAGHGPPKSPSSAAATGHGCRIKEITISRAETEPGPGRAFWVRVWRDGTAQPAGELAGATEWWPQKVLVAVETVEKGGPEEEGLAWGPRETCAKGVRDGVALLHAGALWDSGVSGGRLREFWLLLLFKVFIEQVLYVALRNGVGQFIY